jgi:hypothetical protein
VGFEYFFVQGLDLALISDTTQLTYTLSAFLPLLATPFPVFVKIPVDELIDLLELLLLMSSAVFMWPPVMRWIGIAD